MAALLQGQSIGSVAKEYNIPKGTIKSWKSRSPDELQPVATPKKAQEIGDLLTQYLAENLATLRDQAVVFRDPAWLRKQDAAALATLHGVMTDKAVRLMEAFGKAKG